MSGEILLQGNGFVVVAGSVGGNLAREFRDARIEPREFEVLLDLYVCARRRGVWRKTEIVDVEGGQLRFGFVAIDGVVGIEVIYGAARIGADLAKISYETAGAVGKKYDVGAEGLH